MLQNLLCCEEHTTLHILGFSLFDSIFSALLEPADNLQYSGHRGDFADSKGTYISMCWKHEIKMSKGSICSYSLVSELVGRFHFL